MSEKRAYKRRTEVFEKICSNKNCGKPFKAIKESKILCEPCTHAKSSRESHRRTRDKEFIRKQKVIENIT